MNNKRPPHPWPVNSTTPPASSTPASAASHPMSVPRSDPAYNHQTPLPPILPAKRAYEDEAWLAHQQQQIQQPSHPAQPSQPLHIPSHSQHITSHPSHQPHIRMPNVRSNPMPSNSTPLSNHNPDLYPLPPRHDSRHDSRFTKDAFEDVKIPYPPSRRHVPSTSNPIHMSQPLPQSAGPGASPGASAAAAAAAAAVAGPHQSAPPAPPSSSTGANSSPMDAFVLAAEMGARAQSAVDSTSGEGVFETYELGKTIVASSKLYANQRRSNRLLPGGSDSTTAACYMIGGTPDSVLSPLISRVNPCDPREERCKAVERVLKDKTRGAICALNGENPREARADNLAAVRICEVVADVLVAYSSRRLVESRKELYMTVTKQEGLIKELKEELAKEKRRRVEVENECWCKGQNADGRSMMTTDVHAFERDKLVRRGVLTSSGHRSIDSDRGSLSETPAEKGEGQ